jgi:hypothetical protein
MTAPNPASPATLTLVPAPLRRDQIDRFVLVKDPNTLVWWESAEPRGPVSLGLYHATADGKRTACGWPAVFVEEDPGMGTADRANDIMTCLSCQGMVRRVRAEDPEVVKVRRYHALRTAEKRAGLIVSSRHYTQATSSGKVAR